MIFPFAAVVGQEAAKKALICCLINKNCGGVLLCGERGTAKSTLARGIRGICGSRFTELPLNTTEDRLLGGVDFAASVVTGRKTYTSSLLEQADGGILYVDEINLLSDYLTSCLTEAAAIGRYRAERENGFCDVMSRFCLIGSMNPDEGGLSPQLLDRFGLCVYVGTENNAAERAETARRRLAFEEDEAAFEKSWRDETKRIGDAVLKAKELLPKVYISEDGLKLAAELAKRCESAGHRGEIFTVEAAKAIAAYDGRTEVSPDDIYEAAVFALAHRLREGRFEEKENDVQKNGAEQEDTPPETDKTPPEAGKTPSEADKTPPEADKTPSEADKTPSEADKTPPEADEKCREKSPEESWAEKGKFYLQREKNPQYDMQTASGLLKETLDTSAGIYKAGAWLDNVWLRKKSQGSGRRSLVKTSRRQGRYVRASFCTGQLKDGADIAFDATLRAAAPYQKHRVKKGRAVVLCPDDFRQKLREKRTGNTILFVVDASGSMGANRRMKTVKGIVMSFLKDAYEKRDKVGMIAFKGSEASLILPVTRSVEFAKKCLESLPTGGRTPLAEGIEKGLSVLSAECRRIPDTLPVMVLVSDGRANAGKEAFKEALKQAKRAGQMDIHCVVLDTEQGPVRLGLARELAEAMNGRYLDAQLFKALEQEFK